MQVIIKMLFYNLSRNNMGIQLSINKPVLVLKSRQYTIVQYCTMVNSVARGCLSVYTFYSSQTLNGILYGKYCCYGFYSDVCAYFVSTSSSLRRVYNKLQSSTLRAVSDSKLDLVVRFQNIWENKYVLYTHNTLPIKIFLSI